MAASPIPLESRFHSLIIGKGLAMTFSLDREMIGIPCPHCGKELKETIGRLKRDPVIACRHCNQETKIEASQLRRAIDSAQKSLDALGKALGKLR
jgi:transcription elongation factor Elf1